MVSPDGDDRLNKSKPIWRRLDSSYTPSASLYSATLLRPRLTPLRSADFGSLDAEPLDFGLRPKSTNVLSSAVFL
jgi:hypothetical protein